MQHRKTTYVEGSELIEISFPGERTVIDDREASQHRLIVDNWESFAAAAYEGFRRFGIGAVVVEEDALSGEQMRHPFLRHKIWYATSLDAWTKPDRLGQAARWLEKQIQTYSPQNACLFIFLGEDEEPTVYLVESTLKPETALSRIKALLN